MAEGWLFRLRSTLGAPHAVPAWPAGRESGGEAMPAVRDADAGTTTADDPATGPAADPAAPR
jgi:hypothetical protein